MPAHSLAWAYMPPMVFMLPSLGTEESRTVEGSRSSMGLLQERISGQGRPASRPTGRQVRPRGGSLGKASSVWITLPKAFQVEEE